MRLSCGWKLPEFFLTCVEGEGKIMETESVCFVFALII